MILFGELENGNINLMRRLIKICNMIIMRMFGRSMAILNVSAISQSQPEEMLPSGSLQQKRLIERDICNRRDEH